MKTECPFCKQHYEIDIQFLNQEVSCSICGKNFQVEPLPNTFNTEPQKLSKKTETIIQTNVKQGALIGAGVCLALAICFHIMSNIMIIIYAPLYFAAFILSIVAMAQKRIFGGVLFFIATLILPTLIFGINLSRFEKGTENSEATASTQRSNTEKVPNTIESNAQSHKKNIVESPELPGLCGVMFGSKFQKESAISTGKLTSGVSYYTISLKNYFMDFRDVSVLITPKTNFIHTIWISREFSSGSMAQEEFKKIKAVLEKHYNRQSTQKRFSVYPEYIFHFNNATILLRANILLSSGKIEIIAVDTKLHALAEKEANDIAVENTDTSVL